jgi:hypothetical protein
LGDERAGLGQSQLEITRCVKAEFGWSKVAGVERCDVQGRTSAYYLGEKVRSRSAWVEDFQAKLLSTGCGVGVGVEIGVGVIAGDEEDDTAGVDTGVEIGVLGSAMGVELDDNKEELAGPGLDEL